MSETPDLGKTPGDPGEQPTYQSYERPQNPYPQNPYAQNPYQPNPYQPSGPAPYGALSPQGIPWGPPPDHPQAVTSLILGVLSIAACQLLGPFALVVGRKTMKEIDASQGRLGGRGQAQAGFVLGIVGTVILALVAAYLVAAFFLVVASI